ncbi:hypothetical protein IC582_004732 [Cucumis melo]
MLKILFFVMSCGMWIRLESPFLSAFLDFCVGFFFRKILPSSLKQPLQVLLSKFYLSVIGCVRGLVCLIFLPVFVLLDLILSHLLLI